MTTISCASDKEMYRRPPSTCQLDTMNTYTCNTNAPVVIQAVINDILRDIVNQFVIVYQDDILIFSSSLQEHVKPEKCEFHDPGPVPGVHHQAWPDTNGLSKGLSSCGLALPLIGLGSTKFPQFCHFYSEFILNFSTVPTPLSAFNKGNTARFCWGPEMELNSNAILPLPRLILPNPDIHFIVEVDVSDVGVGAMLSQRREDNKLHPCSFLSHCLTPTERNYHMGDWGLLADKLVLEVWRHWLDGAKNWFQVLTDHKTLEYIQQTKRLNLHQVCWSLFFNPFQFILSYQGEAVIQWFM